MSRQIDLALGLLDHQVVDVDGRRCGNVDDLDFEGVRSGSPSVTAIVVGRRKPVRIPASPERVHLRDAVPWSAVVRVDRRGVVVRDGTELR